MDDTMRVYSIDVVFSFLSRFFFLLRVINNVYSIIRARPKKGTRIRITLLVIKSMYYDYVYCLFIMLCYSVVYFLPFFCLLFFNLAVIFSVLLFLPALA